MKKGKMVGAIALTAALAMGTMPAFATEPSADTVKEFDNTDGGKTEIKAAVEKSLSTQIKASVPLKVTVVFAATGESTIQAPGNDVYMITNTGTDAIQVTDVTLTDNSNLFTFDGLAKSGEDWYNTTDTNALTSGNYLMFTYTTADNYTYLSPSHPLSLAKAKAGMNANDENVLTGAKNFTAETLTSNGDTLPITLGGQAVLFSTIDNSQLTDTICTLTYTIAAATA